ncbi:lysozyme inhibitor LprI family protein [Rhizobium sp. 9140]|uniref:lysozyme inhibitor LprI family protein n=1 Tax=Rhizobium sp. 9140 TaxID=1761900 RepID=UPI000AD907B1|nr:lysozyme inhibitor LprI family protein [Rhizobium sp. 9140]
MRLAYPGATLAFSLVFGAGSASSAGPDDPDCSKAVTQSDMTACSQQDYETADVALNAAYRKTLARAQAMDKDLADLGDHMVGAVEALKTAQRAWIAYRDGQCALAGFEARGGSMEPMLVAGCLAELTTKRTDELNAALADR